MILDRRPFPEAAAIYLPGNANMLDCSDRDSGTHSRTKNEARFHA
jgi:hypothetical protein